MTQVSIYKHSLDTIGSNASYKAVLKAIKEGRWQGEVESLRDLLSCGEKDNYDDQKRGLPAVTFSGLFESRADNKLASYTNMMVIDIDHLTKEQIKIYRESLSADKFIHAFFISPSNEGLKILVKISSGEKHHLQAYLSLEKYFKDNYLVRVDEKCKNISRLCYVSYDPNLYLNDDCEVWLVDTQFKSVSSGKNSFSKRPEKYKDYLVSKDAKAALEICVKWTERHHQYSDGNRNNFMHILASNLNRAGVYFNDALLISYDNYSDLDFKEVEQCFSSAYSRKFEHNTIDIYTEKEKLSKEDAYEQSLSIEQRNIYDTTKELLEAKIKNNTIGKLVRPYGREKAFTKEEIDDLMRKAKEKVDLVVSENLIPHESIEESMLSILDNFSHTAGVSSTMFEIDEAMGSGFMPGSLYGFIGDGKTYKSIFAHWVASEGAKQDELCLYLNGEMSKLQLLERAVEKELGRHLTSEIKNKTINAENLPVIAKEINDILKGNFHMVSSSGWTRESIRETINDIEAKSGKKVSLICIDGLSQLSDTKNNEIFSAISNSGELKELAKECNIAVAVLVHVSGSGGKHFRDTSSLVRGGKKVCCNMDSMFCFSLLIDEGSSNFEQGDIVYLPNKFYLRFIDKRNSGVIINKIINVERPMKLTALDVDPYLMEVSMK